MLCNRRSATALVAAGHKYKTIKANTWIPAQKHCWEDEKIANKLLSQNTLDRSISNKVKSKITIRPM